MSDYLSAPRIKVCGVTRQTDIDQCVSLGVSAIGLVFHPDSPRYVTVPLAQGLLAGIPPFVTSVGLFMDAPAEVVQATLQALPLDLLQFHGQETVSYCEQFTRPYIKACGMGGKRRTDLASVHQHTKAKGILLDSHQAGQAGGTGKVFDWMEAPKNLVKPIILAGGLNPDNVAQAIKQVNPYAVDVSSGVESAPGIKSPEKLRAFIRGVHNSHAN